MKSASAAFSTTSSAGIPARQSNRDFLGSGATATTEPPLAPQLLTHPPTRGLADRRNFLSAALAGIVATFFPARALRAEPAPRRLLLNRFAIAGFRHHAGPRCLPFLAKGEPLLLQAEPAHPMDHYAVRICWQGHLLGYVPRTDNRHLSRLLRQGAQLRAHIIQLRPNAAPWEQVRIAVEMLA